jgi:molybdenum cofactor cytidylyltransferase
MKPFYKFTLVDDEGKAFFGPGPYRLLRSLERLGSLSAAARELEMSYSKAIRIVADAERGLGFKLTRRRIGGEAGGGSELTHEAQEFMAAYDAWVAEAKAASTALFYQAMATHSIALAILANGAAKRFGSQKLLANCAGVPVVERVFEVAEKLNVRTVVSCHDEAVQSLAKEHGFTVVTPEGVEQSDSVRACVEALQGVGAVVVLLGDQPGCSEETLRKVIETHKDQPECIVLVTWQGQGRGPVLFPAGYLKELARVTGDAGGTAILAREAAAGRVITVEASSEVEILDVDTPEALEEVCALLTN